MSATAFAPAPARADAPRSNGDATAIAVLSWTWAAVAVEPAGSAPARWLAPHPSDARLAAHLTTSAVAACGF